MTILDYSDRNKGITDIIRAWGDSLTAGAGGTSFTVHLTNRLRRRSINHGIGGQTAIQIAARAGGVPIYVTTTVPFTGGGSIPCTVNINFLGTNADNNTRKMSGYIGDNQYFIQRTATGTSPNQVESYTITSQQNSGASAFTNLLFEPDEAFNAVDDINILGLGRNDQNIGKLPFYVNETILKFNKPRRVLVWGILNATYEPTGSAAAIGNKAYNDSARLEYGDHYVEVTPPTLAEMSYIGFEPIAQDLIEIANGYFPMRLRADNVHLNSLGYLILANRFADKIIKFGW